MKRIVPLFLLIGACAPDIAQSPPPGEAVVVRFDPAHAVVPAPNDLALTTGKIVVPPGPNDAPAQTEFNQSYLGNLGGFPFESTASVTVTADLNPATVTPANVIGLDITDATKPVPVALAPVYTSANKTLAIAPPDGGWTRGHRYAVVLVSGANGLRGAQNQDVIGDVTWSLVSSPRPLVTCDDAELTQNCKLNVDVLPSAETDLGKRLADQLATAKQLEHIRLGYAPLLDSFAAQGKDRSVIPIAWTFTIVDQSEVTFDPAHNIIPFPNDIVRDPTTGKVKLPNPQTGAPLTAADCNTTDASLLLYCGLNTLDGFSTTAPPISENGDAVGALTQGLFDAATLGTSVGLVAVKTGPQVTTPNFTPCINCNSSKDLAGNAQTIQQLQLSLNAPLDERTTYLAYITTDAKDSTGKNVTANPLFALVRSKASLVTAEGHAAVSLITDEQANQLEPLRAGMAPALDALAAKGITRDKLALAWAFTTQSEASVLDQLRTLPTQAGAAGLPDTPLQMGDVTAVYTNKLGAENIPDVAKFYSGVFLTPNLLTGTAGTFNPDPTKAKLQPTTFVLAVPKGTAPATGWPTVIYGHGLNGSRNDFGQVVEAINKAGILVIATDAPTHGGRSSCTGSKTITAGSLPPGTTPSDDYACAAPAAAGGNMTCDGATPQGLCILTNGTRTACAPTATDPNGDLACAAVGQGRCAADGKCQGTTGTVDCSGGGDAQCAGAGLGLCHPVSKLCEGSQANFAVDGNGLEKISGWNMFSLSNFFSTRDNFRQQVIDLSQVVRLLKSTTNANPLVALNLQLQAQLASATPIVDAAKINYLGQSLGGILGTLFNAVSPDTNNVALNVGGGALTKLVLDSPTLALFKAALLQTLDGQGIKPGTPAFDQFVGTVQWILDPADPANMGYRLTNTVDTGAGPSPNANRKVFLQFIENDQYVINESNLALVAGANRKFVPTPPSYGCVAPLFCYEFTEAKDGFDKTSLPLAARHGFLRNFTNPAITTKAQGQITTFLANGTGP